jgi:cytoskeleton protein RodZ
MKQNSQETLGQYLRQARESRNVSLEELSRTTRISLPFLRALEENDFDFFSQHEFIPGFLKLYARHLGLDGQEVLQRYDFQSKVQSQTKTFQQLPLSLHFDSPIKKAPAQRWVPGKRFTRKIILASVFLIALGLFLYIHFMPGRGRDPEPSKAALPKDIEPEGPGEKTAGLSPVGPTEKESLPSRTLDRPEITAPVKDSEAKTEGDAPEKIIPEMQPKMKVIGNRDSKRYHLPGMKYYDKVLEYHRVEFDSEEEAIQAGYRKARE